MKQKDLSIGKTKASTFFTQTHTSSHGSGMLNAKWSIHTYFIYLLSIGKEKRAMTNSSIRPFVAPRIDEIGNVYAPLSLSLH